MLHAMLLANIIYWMQSSAAEPLPIQLADLLYPGNATVCQLTISGVAARDHGAWTCVISDNLSLDTTKQVVRLGVAVGGHLELSQLPGQNTLLCRWGW